MSTTSARMVAALTLVAGLVGALPAPVLAGEAEVVSGDVGRRLDEAVRQTTRGDFWGAVLVAKGGKVLLAKGYGLADYDSRPNDANTLFEIASTTKQFTAAAILKLEMDGKLKLTDALPKFFRGVPKDKRKITLHHLLTHTSGITGRAGVAYASPISRKQYVKHVLGQPMESKPGEKFAYNNATYALLAAVVETVSKQSFEAYSKEKLFEPAGLTDTGFVRDEDLDEARDTVRRGERMPEATAIDWHWGWGYRGMGGVISTVHDLHAWDRALRGDAVFDAKAKAKLYEPSLEGYALGWKVEPTDRGTSKVHHSGGVHGYACQYARYLEDDAVIVVLSNGRTNIHAVEQALAAAIFPPPPFTAHLNVKDFEPNENQIVKLPDTMGWSVAKDGSKVVLALRDSRSEKVAARLVLPRGPAMKLQHELTGALRDQPDPEGAPTAVEAGMYLQPYRLAGPELTITDGLSIMLKARYVGRGRDGERVVDERITFSLVDSKRGQWPIMVKMPASVAKTLLNDLRTALQ